ncbi:hypothetical protein DNTS_004430 [Danionella cerebrum]|uniref:J domain-containing protein n=1 Tax=Danionella cerebrum TaxID=2873325 RepID=A0A553R773_9TELE|nr:hypothetical protein DNTS_004430 [Danionella translucida]
MFPLYLQSRSVSADVRGPQGPRIGTAAEGEVNKNDKRGRVRGSDSREQAIDTHSSKLHTTVLHTPLQLPKQLLHTTLLHSQREHRKRLMLCGMRGSLVKCAVVCVLITARFFYEAHFPTPPSQCYQLGIISFYILCFSSAVKMNVLKENRDLACFYTTKHSWRGKYKRVFSVGTHGITTYNPTTLEVTNQVIRRSWCYGDVVSISPVGRGQGSEFSLSFRKSSGKKMETLKFSCDQRAEILTEALKFRTDFAEGKITGRRYECVKQHWSECGRSVSLEVTPAGIDQLDRRTGVRICTYEYRSIEGFALISDQPGGFVIVHGGFGRLHVFASDQRDEILRSAIDHAGSFVGITLRTRGEPLTTDLTIGERLGKFSSDENITSLTEFIVQKITHRHTEPVKRILSLTETCLVERDPASYNIIRRYSSTDRDALLASVLDSVRASGNRDVCVKICPTQRGQRWGVLSAPVEEEVESLHLRFLAAPPNGNFSDAVFRFNANISYSGVLHAVTQDGLFSENKEKLIGSAILALLAQESEPPEAQLEAQFHCLRRLTASRAGFQAFTQLPRFREKLGVKTVKALKRNNNGVTHAAVDMLCALMCVSPSLSSPMHDDYDLRQEQLNKASLLSSKKFLENLLEKFIINVEQGTGALVISSLLDFLTFALCAPYSETTESQQFDTLLEMVAAHGRTLFRLFQHPSLAIVKGAGLIMKAIVEVSVSARACTCVWMASPDLDSVRACVCVHQEGEQEMASRMQDLALSEGALPRHLHTALFTISSDQRMLTHRQLSRHLVALWMAENPVALNLLKRILVGTSVETAWPSGLLVYLDSSDAVPERDVDRMHVRDNLKIASLTLKEIWLEAVVDRNPYSALPVDVYRLTPGQVRVKPPPSCILEDQFGRTKVPEWQRVAGKAAKEVEKFAKEKADLVLMHWRDKMGIAQKEQDRNNLNVNQKPVILRKRRQRIKIQSNWELFYYKFQQDHALSSLIWNLRTREELREALEAELRCFSLDRELGNTALISWNHQEFEVKYECLSEEIKIGDYYLRLLLEEDESQNQNSGPGPEAGAIQRSFEFFTELYHRFLLTPRVPMKCVCLQALAVVYGRCHLEIGAFSDTKHIVSMLDRCTDKLERDRLILFLNKLILNKKNVKEILDANGVRILVELLTLAHLHKNRATVPLQSNVLEAAPDMKRESEKEWYFGNADKERRGPFSFEEGSTWYQCGSRDESVNQLALSRYSGRDSDGCSSIPGILSCPSGSSKHRAFPEPRNLYSSLLNSTTDIAWVSSPNGIDGNSSASLRTRTAELPLPRTLDSKQLILELSNSVRSPRDPANAPCVFFTQMQEFWESGVLSARSRCWAQGMDGWRPLQAVPQLKWMLMASGQAVMNHSDLSTLILNMLITMSSFFPSRDEDNAIIRPLPKVKRLVSDGTCLPHIVQLLLTFDPVLVEKVATLLFLVMQDNPVLPRLYLTGVFFFIMMYTGSNVLPIARFLKYTHLKQAFRSEEAQSQDVVQRSVLGPMLPEAMVCYLENHEPERFSEIFLGEFDTPEAIWSCEMRRLMIEKLAAHLSDFSPRLQSNTRAIFQFCPVPALSFPQLHRELFCNIYYLRHLSDESRFPDWPIREPVKLLKDTLDAWKREVEKKPPSMSLDDAYEVLNLPREQGVQSMPPPPESEREQEQAFVRSTHSQGFVKASYRMCVCVCVWVCVRVCVCVLFRHEESTIRKAYFRLAQKYHPDKNPEGRDMFEKVNKAYEFLCSKSARVTDGPDPENIILILKTQSILFNRHRTELQEYKYAGYPMLVRTLRLETEDDQLFSKPSPLLPAATELSFHTLNCSALNAEELRRESGLEVLMEALSRCVSVLTASSKAEDMSVQVCGHVCQCFSVAAQFQECREKVAELPNIIRDVCRILYFAKALPSLASVAVECVSSLSVSPVLQAGLCQAGALWPLLLLLFSYDFTLEESGVPTSTQSNPQQLSNRLACLSLRALARLAGLQISEEESDACASPAPENPAIRKSLAAMLTPYISRKLGTAPPAETLKLLNCNSENPYLIWNNGTRAELLEFLEMQQEASIRRGEGDPALGSQFIFGDHGKELIVGEIFVRVYNEQPTFPLECPQAFASALLDYVGSLAQYLHTLLALTHTDKLESQQHTERLRWAEMSLEALRNVIRNNPGSEMECVGHFKLLFSLLRVHGAGRVQQLALEVVNTVTSNQDCVVNIAESLVLPNLLVLLHSLPSSRQLVLETLYALSSNTKIITEAMSRGALLYLLDLFCNSTHPQVRSQTAELFSKMSSDKLVGPKVRLMLLRFLPPVFMDAMRDNPEASIQIFEGTHENPELIWNDQSRESVSTTVREMMLEFCRQQKDDPDVSWKLPEDFSVPYAASQGELEVGGVYLRIFISQPGWVLRKPREFLVCMLDTLTSLLEKNHPNGEVLETVTTATVSLLSSQSQLADQVPALGHLPRILSALCQKNGAGPRSAIRVLHSLSENELCVRSLAALDTIAPLMVGMKLRADMTAVVCEALNRMFQREQSELVAQALRAGLVQYLLELLEGAAVLESLENPAATKAQIVKALKAMTRSLTLGEQVRLGVGSSCAIRFPSINTAYGDGASFRPESVVGVFVQVNEILSRSSVWSAFKDQKHDLFISDSQSAGFLTGDNLTFSFLLLLTSLPVLLLPSCSLQVSLLLLFWPAAVPCALDINPTVLFRFTDCRLQLGHPSISDTRSDRSSEEKLLLLVKFRSRSGRVSDGRKWIFNDAQRSSSRGERQWRDELKDMEKIPSEPQRQTRGGGGGASPFSRSCC